MSTNFLFVKPALRTTMIMGALAMSSCMIVGPDYEKQNMAVPAEFRGAPSCEESIADLPWWEVLSDKNMRSLLVETFSSNREMRNSLISIVTAAKYVDVAAAPIFPWLGYSGSLSRGQNQSGGYIAGTSGSSSTPISGGMTASWELDLWGKTMRSIEASEADFVASVHTTRALQLSLMRQVATGYLQLLMLDEQLRITRESVVSYRESLDLFEIQLEGGTGTTLQVESARAALAAAEAQVPDLESQIASLENTLCVLAGRMPGKIARSGSLASYAGASKVPAGIPANILAHRPDVLAAESSIRSANAKVGVAIANYFPAISLTSSIGGASSDLGNSLGYRMPGWGVGASLTGPLFQAGTLRASEEIARDTFLAAINTYEQTVLSAMSEVSTTLISREKLAAIIERQETAVKAYRIAVDASMSRYKNGLSNYYEVLTAQQNLFPAEKQLAEYRYQYAASIPTLYTQLGGGWKQSFDQQKAASQSSN